MAVLFEGHRRALSRRHEAGPMPSPPKPASAGVRQDGGSLPTTIYPCRKPRPSWRGGFHGPGRRDLKPTLGPRSLDQHRPASPRIRVLKMHLRTSQPIL